MQNQQKQIIHSVLHTHKYVGVHGKFFMNIKPMGTQSRLLLQRNIVMVTTDPSDKAVHILREQKPRIEKTDHSGRAWKTSCADR